MTQYVIAFGIELLVGLLMGFYLTDKKRGISFRELRIGAALLLLVGAFMMWRNGAVDPITWIHTGLSFVGIFGGIVLGEYFHFKLVRKVTEKIKKEDVHQSIEEFTREVKIFAKDKSGVNEYRMITAMQAAVDKIDKVRYHAVATNRKEIVEELCELSASCRALKRVSHRVSGEKVQEFTERLTSVAWDTLRETEASVQKKMAQPVHAVAIAVRSIHIK